MPTIEITNRDVTSLMCECIEKTESLFERAIHVIDSQYGEAYSKNNPRLIEAYIQAEIYTWRTTIITAVSQDAEAQLKALNASLGRFSEKLDKITSALIDAATALEARTKND